MAICKYRVLARLLSLRAYCVKFHFQYLLEDFGIDTKFTYLLVKYIDTWMW